MNVWEDKSMERTLQGRPGGCSSLDDIKPSTTAVNQLLELVFLIWQFSKESCLSAE